VVDRAVLAERRARRAELGEQMQARRAAEAEALAGELSTEVGRVERELERAREAPARLEAELAERERAWRAAEQRADAERRGRSEDLEEAAARIREAEAEARRARERAQAAQRVARELAEELVRLRRRLAEAEHALAAAAAGSRRPPDVARQPELVPVPPGALRRERAISRAAGSPPAPRRPRAPLPSVADLLAAERRMRPPAAAGDPRAGSERLLAEARALAAAAGERLAETRRAAHLDRGELAEARAAQAHAEEQLRAQRELTARARAALGELRAELAALEAAPRPPAPTPPDGAELARRAAALAAPEPVATSAAVAEQLEAARARLRESAPLEEEPPAEPHPPVERQPPAEPPPEASAERKPRPGSPPASPWLPGAFSRLAAEEPAAAGRVLLGLLPALGAVVEHPVAFELVLPDEGRLLVRAEPGHAEVAPLARAAKGRDVLFRLSGDPAKLGSFAAAQGVGRWRASGGVRLRGRRRRAELLQRLARAPLGFAELATLGVELGPELAYRLLACAVDPAWTAGQAFTLAHETTGLGGRRAWITVRDGRPLAVTDSSPAGPAAATVSCSRAALLPLLAGAPLPGGERAAIRGDAGAVSLLQGWLARAQD